jgi:hypothetical protein
VTNRLYRLVLLIAAAALLAACSAANLLYSNLTLAYSNAAPMLTWAVDDYVDLSDVQKGWVRERLSRVMSWHRARELPAYRRFLASVETDFAGGFTVEEVGAAQREMRAHYHRLVEQVLPDAADFLLELDAEQIGQLERKFGEDNRKLVKDAGKDVDERRERNIRKTVEHLEAWTGRLDDSQRELVATHLRVLPDISADRMADRRYRQAQALDLIRAKPGREAMIAALRRLLVDTESWRRPEYLQRLRERDARNFQMIAALSHTLSPDQRAHLHKRLRAFMSDIASLTAASSNAGG